MTEGEVTLQDGEFALAHKIAQEWSDVPVDRLVAVLSAMEPQLQREHAFKEREARRRHELHMQQLKDSERRHEIELAKQEQQLHRMNHAHRQHLVGVGAGAAVSLSCIGGAIYFGAIGQYVPMVALVGPVLLALTKMFVLRKSDPGDMTIVAKAAGRIAGVQQAPQPPQSPSAAPPNPGAPL